MPKVYEGDDGYVFVSNAHADSQVALPIIIALQGAGFRMWFDAGVEVRSEWPESIAAKVRSCRCFLALITQRLVESENCRSEINYALKLGKDMMVAYLENVRLSPGMEMRLDLK